MKKYSKKKIDEFLEESNAIEGVYDLVSLEQAHYAWDYLETLKVITTHDILKIHKILMLHQNLLPNEKGYFRECAVYIGGRQGLRYDQIPTAIEHWLMNLMDAVENGKKESEIWKEKITKEHHIIYEEIHPWIDGNGRTGRIFMNWERMMLGLPILIIHADWPKEEGEQKTYYSWFKK